MIQTQNPVARSQLQAVRPGTSLLSEWRQYVVYVGFVLIFGAFAIALHDRGFLEPNNLLNIARQTAVIAIMAMAMTFVLSAGEIDLSIGAIAGLTSVIAGMVVASHGLVAGVLCGIATGVVVGSINGALTAWLGIPSFLVTLGMMGIARGTGMWVSGTSPVPVVDEAFNFAFGSGNIGPIPVLVLWVAIIAALAQTGLKSMPFGRKVLATGGGETAARFSGVRTRLVKFQVLDRKSVV